MVKQSDIQVTGYVANYIDVVSKDSSETTVKISSIDVEFLLFDTIKCSMVTYKPFPFNDTNKEIMDYINSKLMNQ